MGRQHSTHNSAPPPAPEGTAGRGDKCQFSSAQNEDALSVVRDTVAQAVRACVAGSTRGNEAGSEQGVLAEQGAPRQHRNEWDNEGSKVVKRVVDQAMLAVVGQFSSDAAPAGVSAHQEMQQQPPSTPPSPSAIDPAPLPLTPAPAASSIRGELPAEAPGHKSTEHLLAHQVPQRAKQMGRQAGRAIASGEEQSAGVIGRLGSCRSSSSNSSKESHAAGPTAVLESHFRLSCLQPAGEHSEILSVCWTPALLHSLPPSRHAVHRGWHSCAQVQALHPLPTCRERDLCCPLSLNHRCLFPACHMLMRCLRRPLRAPLPRSSGIKATCSLPHLQMHCLRWPLQAPLPYPQGQRRLPVPCPVCRCNACGGHSQHHCPCPQGWVNLPVGPRHSPLQLPHVVLLSSSCSCPQWASGPLLGHCRRP